MVSGYVVADNDSASANETTYEYWEYLFTTEPGIGWIDPGLGYITGDILIIVLLVMVICASDKVRSSGYFEVGQFSFYQELAELLLKVTSFKI